MSTNQGMPFFNNYVILDNYMILDNYVILDKYMILDNFIFKLNSEPGWKDG